MDIATLVGLIGSVAVLIYLMLDGGGFSTFYNFHPVAVVFIGSFTVTFIRVGFKEFFGALRAAGGIFKSSSFKPEEFISQAVEIADAARKGGLLSLEGKEINNAFMKKGVQLLIDGHDHEIVKSMLSKEMTLTLERHMWAQKLFRAVADVAPAMGMIGTLIGLVLMMGNMSDPKSIGPAMSIALLATLYGAVLANMVCYPIADKLELRSNQERLAKALVIDALSGIQAGQNPRVIEENLKSYLPSRARDKADKAA